MTLLIISEKPGLTGLIINAVDDPSEIAIGDVLRDLGAFRKVAAISSEHGMRGLVYRLTFEPDPTMPEDYPLGIDAGTPVALWREPGL